MSSLLYSAVVLDDDNRARLIKFVDGVLKIPDEWFYRDWKRIAHHMTIGFKQPVPDHLRDDIGKPVQLTVTKLGISSDAIAVRVDGYHSNNKIPHITIAIPKGGKPFNSNLIKDWHDVRFPDGELVEFQVTGKVKEIYS